MLCKLMLILSMLSFVPASACDEDDIEEIARQSGASVPDRRAAIERTRHHDDLIAQATTALTSRVFILLGDANKLAYSFRRLRQDDTVRDLMAQAYAKNGKIPHVLELFHAKPWEHYHKASFSVWSGDIMIGVFTLAVDDMEMFFEHHPVHLIEANEPLAAELRLAIYQFVIPVIDKFNEHGAAVVEAVPNGARNYHDRLRDMNFALGRAKSERLLTPPDSTVFRYPEKSQAAWMPPTQQLRRPRQTEAPAEVHELVGAH